jgi:hypothetical protein
MPASDIPTTQYRIGGSGAGILDLVARLCRNSARHRGEREFAPHLGDISIRYAAIILCGEPTYEVVQLGRPEPG